MMLELLTEIENLNYFGTSIPNIELNSKMREEKNDNSFTKRNELEEELQTKEGAMQA